MRGTVAKRLRKYAAKHKMVPADYRRLKREWARSNDATKRKAMMAMEG